jgi:hypothetical protein
LKTERVVWAPTCPVFEGRQLETRDGVGNATRAPRLLTSDAVALSAVFEMPIPKPSQLRPEVPPALDRVVMRLLERPLTTRTPSARQAREQLLEVTGEAGAYPTGQRALAEAVKRATAEWPDLARRAAEYAMAQAKTDVASSPVGSTDANKPLLPW